MADKGRALLLRHGQTEWSRDGRHTGRSDLPLTELGEEQARAAGEVLAGRSFARVVVSPLARARRTAELAGFTDFQVDPDLMEWDYGPVEGLSTAQVRQQLGTDWDIWRNGVDQPLERAEIDPQYAAPVSRGESVEDVGRRVRAVIDRVEPLLLDGQDVLLVAHGHSLRILTAVWLKMPAIDGGRFALETAAVSTLSYERNRHVLAGWNLREE